MKKILMVMAFVLGSGICHGAGVVDRVWNSTTLAVVNSTFSARIDTNTISNVFGPVRVGFVNILQIGSFDATLTIYDSKISSQVYNGTPYVLDMSSNAAGHYNLNLELSSGCFIANRGVVPARFQLGWFKY
jgi:hypothetical protein